MWYEEFQNPNLKPSLLKLKQDITKLDWDGKTKDEYWRKAMSDLKLKLVSEFPTLINGWVLHQSVNLSEPFVMFVDIREPENIFSFKNFCENNSVSQVRTILAESSRSVRAQNYSDQSIFGMTYDCHIRNDGDLNELRKTAGSFVEQEILEGRSKERFY